MGKNSTGFNHPSVPSRSPVQKPTPQGEPRRTPTARKSPQDNVTFGKPRVVGVPKGTGPSKVASVHVQGGSQDPPRVSAGG